MTSSPQSFKDIAAWKKGQELFVGIMRLIRNLPREERAWIAPQIGGAALSVPSNIAEGKGREHLGEYLHHLSYSRGSTNEVESQLISLRRAEIVPASCTEPLEELSDEVSRMIYSLARSLRPYRRRSARS
jgi:four helix bundle protein